MRNAAPVGDPVTNAALVVALQDLPALRALQRALTAIVDPLIDGSPAPVDALNALAAAEPAVICSSAERMGSCGRRCGRNNRRSQGS